MCESHPDTTPRFSTLTRLAGGGVLPRLRFGLLLGLLLASLLSAADDLGSRLQRVEPVEPAASMGSFSVIPGFRIEQVAAEPLVCDPVDLAFDENGRLYVSEYIGYSENDEHAPGRIALLEDTDNDGLLDKRMLFADRLQWNATVTCFDGGVFAGASPDLLYLKDTDGDGRADVREVVITGFGCSNVNQFLNSLRWRIDNRIHGIAAGGAGQLEALRWQRTTGQEVPAVEVRGRDFSFEPRTGRLRLESSGDQHGMGLDRWGRKFGASNGNHCQMVMYEDRYVARNPHLRAPVAHVNISPDGKLPPVYRTSPREPWRIVWSERKLVSQGQDWLNTRVGCFSAACGMTVYTGSAWPAEFRGNLFIAEPSGNLVHRKRLEPDGVGFLAYRTEQEREFLTSNEIWFRPVQFTNAPDGTLWFADMYREVIEHPKTFMTDIKEMLDLNSGNDRGRIYRIVPEGFTQPEPPRLGSLSTPQLVRLLEHPNGWHRRTASRLLYERQDDRARPELERLARGSGFPVGRMQAMYALDGMGALSAEIVVERLDDQHARVREHAVRLAEKVLDDSPAVCRKLCRMAGDDDLRVRYQLAFTLGEIPAAASTAALARIAVTDGFDSWVRLAVLSSCGGRAWDLFGRLAANRRWCADPAAWAFMEQLAEQIGRQNRSGEVDRVLTWLEATTDVDHLLTVAVVEGLARSSGTVRRRMALGEFTRVSDLLSEMVRQAERLALDERLTPESRVKAIRSMSIAPLEVIGDALVELLDGRQPHAVQSQALAALGRQSDVEVAEIIVGAWTTFSPQVQRAACEALFARANRLAVLLRAIEQGRIAPSQLDPARIQFLLSYADEEIRSEADRLLGGVKLARREEVVADYRESLKMKGDADGGKEIFERECATCHRLDGVGFDLGLPLAGIKERGAETILTAVLDPNREVQPQYLNYALVTDDGLCVTGIITAETATSLTLQRAEGEGATVLRVNVDELANTGLSIMPEGLEEQISKQQMADLIAYLMSRE